MQLRASKKTYISSSRHCFSLYICPEWQLSLVFWYENENDEVVKAFHIFWAHSRRLHVSKQQVKAALLSRVLSVHIPIEASTKDNVSIYTKHGTMLSYTSFA